MVSPPPLQTDIQQPDNSHRWLVFGLISTVYLFVYFHRVSTSVIVPDLLRAFNTHATALGIMSSMYFYVYALEQPIVGHLSDALGPRRVVGYWSVVAAFGCVVFALAPSIQMASVGRGLIGLGVGGVYVPAMKAFSQWFRENEFATVTGFLMSAGNIGAIVATVPLAWMAESWGWRLSFFIIGGLTLALAFCVLFLLRDHPDTFDRPSPSATATTQGTSPTAFAFNVLASLRFWLLGAVFAGVFGTYLTYQGLWATPSLMAMHNLSQLHASQMNMLVPIGFIIGAPIFGRLVDRGFRDKARMLVIQLSILTGAWFFLALGAQAAGLLFVMPVLVIMGAVTGGFASAIWGIVRETTPLRVLGLTTGLLNTAPFVGVALFQPATGIILDKVGRVHDAYPAAAYEQAFLVCALTVLACLILSVCFKNTLGRRAKDEELSA